jgi:hypothetical protein
MAAISFSRCPFPEDPGLTQTDVKPDQAQYCTPEECRDCFLPRTYIKAHIVLESTTLDVTSPFFPPAMTCSASFVKRRMVSAHIIQVFKVPSAKCLELKGAA